jgi:uncharacterized protein YecE (DUF72 family)
MSGIHLGTFACTVAGWEGSFYPEGMKPADYLTHYAAKFDTVEVNLTFYRTPSVATVSGWERKTPNGFILAAQVPETITHGRVLPDCDEDLKYFLETMDSMGDRVGPFLFQFEYFNKKACNRGDEFLARRPRE